MNFIYLLNIYESKRYFYDFLEHFYSLTFDFQFQFSLKNNSILLVFTKVVNLWGQLPM